MERRQRIGNARQPTALLLICLFSLVFLGGVSVQANDTQTKALLDLINLDYPGLEAVKAEVLAGNHSRAGELLLRHYRTRTRPGWYWDDRKPEPICAALDDTTADDVLDRRFTILLKTAQLDRKIDWAATPFGDREWHWLLNRHVHLQALGMEYLRTRDEKYAAEFDEIMKDWILSNPVPSESSNNSHNWRTIEAGIRMFSSWPAVWHFFKDSPSFTADTRILMLRSFAEHADYLARFPTAGNWTLMENDGLLHVGALFPEFRDAPEWRRKAIERLTAQMKVQVYPDGAQYELTTSYHNVSLWSFLHPLALGRIADGIDFPPEHLDKLQEMMRFNMGIMRPDGYWPMINDSDLSTVGEMVTDPAKSLGADSIPKIKRILDMKPFTGSVFLPYAGIACMRTGSEKDDLYLMMDAGPFGAGHQHEDKLNLEVYAHGQAHLLDPGRYSYHVGEPFRATGAHSTIMVDGEGQNRRGADRAAWIVSEPAPGNRWLSTPGFDYFEGVYDDGFGQENNIRVTHTRKVFFVKPEYWIITDVLLGEGDHLFEQLWHFTPGEISTRPGIARTNSTSGSNLAVVRSDNTLPRIVEGEETPILGYISYRYNEREPAPTAVFTRQCTAPVSFETILYPTPAGNSYVPEVTQLKCLVDGKRPGDGRVSAISIRVPDHEDLFIISHHPHDICKTKKFLDFEFTGEAVWIRTNNQGEIEKTASIGGGRLIQKGLDITITKRF